MNNIAKCLATVALFGVACPLVGYMLFFLCAWLSLHDLRSFSMPASNFLHSLIDFGIPSSIGGLLFFFSVRFFSRRSTSHLHATTRAFIGAAVFALLFTLPVVVKLITHGNWKIFMFVVVFATFAGFVLGLICPKAWLQLHSPSEANSLRST